MIHNNKHHKKLPAAAAKPVPQQTAQLSSQPGAQPPPTEADTPEGAEVPSPSGDNTTMAADTSGVSEANIHPDRPGFRCGKCNIYCPTEASFKIYIQKHKNTPCPFCLQKWFNTGSRDKHIWEWHKDKINTISCRVVDCPEKFPTEKELHMHLRRQHGVVCTVPKYRATVDYTSRLRAPWNLPRCMANSDTREAVANHYPGLATANSYLGMTST